MKKILQAKNLSIRIGQHEVVKKLNFSLFEKETVALVGETASGKTITAQALCKLNPDQKVSGQVFFEKQDLISLSLKELTAIRGRKIAYIFQDPFTYLNPLLKIKTQLLESSVLSQKVLFSLLKLSGFANPALLFTKYPHELSGGERQRLLIAIALSSKPKVLVADEPTTALDVTIQAQIISLLKTIQQKTEISIFLISHNLKLVATLAKRILVMYAGEIVEEGLSSDILKSPKHPYTQMLLKALPSLKENNFADLQNAGDLYDHHHQTTGCSFAPRCPSALAICHQQKPPFLDLNNLNQLNKTTHDQPKQNKPDNDKQNQDQLGRVKHKTACFLQLKKREMLCPKT